MTKTIGIAMTVDLGDKVTMKLVQVPAGKFTMGSPEAEKKAAVKEAVAAGNSEKDATDVFKDEVQHEVTISKPFYMGITHVTVDQFAAFVKDSGYKTEAEKDGWAGGFEIKDGKLNDKRVNGCSWRKPSFDQKGDHPVVQVSWNDAKAFCDWLSKKSGKTVVLPTEAQWEYACRAGTKTAYPWGDSPVMAGMHFRRITITPNGAAIPHYLAIAGDSEAALEIKPQTLAASRKLVAEAGTLLGTRPYRQYHFLVTLSDTLGGWGGLEHHECTTIGLRENSFTDDALNACGMMVLAHEFAHSWNGKYRRPEGLLNDDFQQPVKDDLLWVYEGLTEYLGNVLSARCGYRTEPQFREFLASDAAWHDHSAGRTWRPLSDTAVAAQLLYSATAEWGSWRRGVDFYGEGALIWLEADILIRQKTTGKRSLDDFCRAFFGGQDGAPAVKGYNLNEVLAALNAVAAHDWEAFFNQRVHSTTTHAPMGGIEQSGWRLVYASKQTDMLKAMETDSKTFDERWSIGLTLGEAGKIKDVIPNLPAAKAGLAPTMKLIAVNGRRFSLELLRREIGALKGENTSIELLAENDEFYRTFRVKYGGGGRYPALERDETKPDLLSQIIKPRTESAQ